MTDVRPTTKAIPRSGRFAHARKTRGGAYVEYAIPLALAGIVLAIAGGAWTRARHPPVAAPASSASSSVAAPDGAATRAAPLTSSITTAPRARPTDEAPR